MSNIHGFIDYNTFSYKLLVEIISECFEIQKGKCLKYKDQKPIRLHFWCKYEVVNVQVHHEENIIEYELISFLNDIKAQNKAMEFNDLLYARLDAESQEFHVF
tara:strand:+ start:1638 stop:1946 length:309 start_codon:yes stop_codon:yes gene_type:complete